MGNVDFADRNSINADAYLLNIANDSTAEAIATSAATASAEIKITAITVAGGVPQLTYRKTYGNGKVVLRGSATIGALASWHDGRLANDRFFKTVLRLK